MRAKGPFVVQKQQHLTHTDVNIRAPGSQPRVLTVHDGQHNIRETAAFFAAAEDMYAALRGLVPLSQHVAAGIEALLKDKATPEQTAQIVDMTRLAFVAATQAVRKADTPVDGVPENIAISDPTYEELINAMNEIRRTVGGDPREMGEDSGVEFEAVADINHIIEILGLLEPKASRERREAAE